MFDIVLIDLVLRRVLPVDYGVSWDKAEAFLADWNEFPRDCVAVAIPSDLVASFKRCVSSTTLEGAIVSSSL